MAYVYRHIRLDKNEPFYIGIGSDNNYKRAYSKDSRNKIWKAIAYKTNYEVQIMLDKLTWDDACEKEIEFINLYKRKCDNGILANLSIGGEGGASGFKRDIDSIKKGILKRIGIKKSDECKQKISLKLKGIKRDDNFKDKIRNRMMGNTYTSGIALSQEHRNKIGMANKGNKKAIVQCPFCKISGGLPALKRWHFENCKNK